MIVKLSSSFLYFNSVVKFRVKIKDDGTLDKPEIIGKWTIPIQGAKEYNKPKKKQVTLTTESQGTQYL